MEGVALDGVASGSWSAIGTVSLGAEELSPGYFAVTVVIWALAYYPRSIDIQSNLAELEAQASTSLSGTSLDARLSELENEAAFATPRPLV